MISALLYDRLFVRATPHGRNEVLPLERGRPLKDSGMNSPMSAAASYYVSWLSSRQDLLRNEAAAAFALAGRVHPLGRTDLSRRIKRPAERVP